MGWLAGSTGQPRERRGSAPATAKALNQPEHGSIAPAEYAQPWLPRSHPHASARPNEHGLACQLQPHSALMHLHPSTRPGSADERGHQQGRGGRTCGHLGDRSITRGSKASLKRGQPLTLGGTASILTVLKRSVVLWVKAMNQ